MKNNKTNLISAILFILAGILLTVAAVFQTQTTSKYLLAAASLCEFISGIGFIYTYIKNRKIINGKNEL